MKHRLLKLGVFLLLGAIINVAVAWGCAAFSPIPMQSAPSKWMWMAQSDRDWWDEHAPPQVEKLLVNEWGGERSTVRGVGIQLKLMSGQSHVLGTDSVPEYCQSTSSGWPLSAFSGELWQLPKAYTVERFTRDAWKISEMKLLPSGMYSWPRLLPLRPIWSGFAINAIIYAAVACILFFAATSVRCRRRIKRGLCPACAYPVGTNPRCTECGKPVVVPRLVGDSTESCEMQTRHPDRSLHDSVAAATTSRGTE